MEIKLTKEQYKMLMKMVMVGNDIYGILGDEISEDYKNESNKIDEFRGYILGRAKDFGCGHLTEEYMGKIIPSDDFSEEMQMVTDDYDDETFWHELETRLGKRDFEFAMTDEERAKAEKTGILPSRVFDFYEKWRKEFEENGVERLGIIGTFWRRFF